MNEYEILLRKHEIYKITLPNAIDVLRKGLLYFIGEGYRWLPEYDEVAEWLSDNKKKGLLLFGGNGLGKTIICTKILPVILKSKLCLDYYCIDASNLVEYYNNSVENYNITISSNPIIIDDFGIESVYNNFGEKRDLFSSIVDQAEKKGRLLILSTNLTPEEISERYGLRTLDRLHGIVRAIKFNGESLRG